MPPPCLSNVQLYIHPPCPSQTHACCTRRTCGRAHLKVVIGRQHGDGRIQGSIMQHLIWHLGTQHILFGEGRINGSIMYHIIWHLGHNTFNPR